MKYLFSVGLVLAIFRLATVAQAAPSASAYIEALLIADRVSATSLGRVKAGATRRLVNPHSLIITPALSRQLPRNASVTLTANTKVVPQLRPGTLRWILEKPRSGWRSLHLIAVVTERKKKGKASQFMLTFAKSDPEKSGPPADSTVIPSTPESVPPNSTRTPTPVPPTATVIPEPNPLPTAPPTAVATTPSAFPSFTPTSTLPPTSVPTLTLTPPDTATLTPVAAATPTPLPTNTPTRTPTIGATATFTSVPTSTPTPAATPMYSWSSLPIGGGISIQGVLVHPLVPDTIYIHTDIGGAYRWNPATQAWIQLLDKVTFWNSNLYGVESMAIDESDITGNTVYVALGKYAASWANTPYGAVWKTTDGGTTWTDTNIPQIKVNSQGGSQDYGQKLIVDPANPSVVYYGSRMNGLLRSVNGVWSTISSAPLGDTTNGLTGGGSGISFIVFDKTSGTVSSPLRTRNIYLGVHGAAHGIYASSDGGDTWTLLSGGPVNPYRATVTNAGVLLVTHPTGIARYASGLFSNVSPSPLQYGAIAADPQNANHVISSRTGWNKPLYRSTDGGVTWTVVNWTTTSTVPWMPSSYFGGNTHDVAIDPFYPGRVWAVDWFSVMRTDSIDQSPSLWTNFNRNIEGVVTTAPLVSPPSGSVIVHSGLADVGGFPHTSLTEYPSINPRDRGLPPNLNCTGIDFQESDPSFVVRVGRDYWSGPGGGGYSIDGGINWTTFPSYPPNTNGGRIAVSATGGSIVWQTAGGYPYSSKDLGVSWTQAVGAPSGAKGESLFEFNQPLAADRVLANTFYLYKSGTLYRSTDEGLNWIPRITGLPSVTKHEVVTKPGAPGELWLALDWSGLRYSTDGGATFTVIPKVQLAKMVSFGKPRPGSSEPPLYLYGYMENSIGVFRSEDRGVTWTRLDEGDQAFDDEPNTMAADRQTFGRVFIGTNGRGIVYGQTNEREDQGL